MTTERDRLIDAALGHVIFEGMGAQAIAEAAREVGMSDDLARVYLPRGGADLAAEYHRRGDAALREWLAQTAMQGAFRQRVIDAVMQRLAISDREMARAGAAVLALPQNVGLGAKLVWGTADAIWIGLGDTAQDVNWYSKRATLSAIYAATVLYWLGDDSADFAATREFLQRRVDGLMRFEKIKGRLHALPGAARLTRLATGWIKRPTMQSSPGRGKWGNDA